MDWAIALGAVALLGMLLGPTRVRPTDAVYDPSAPRDPFNAGLYLEPRELHLGEASR
jgi:hypothetical protein